MQKILTQPYNRQSFIEKVLLPTFQGRVDDLKIYDSSGAETLALTASEQKFAIRVIKYGEFTTRDGLGIGRKVSLYEVILKDAQRVERSHVGIAALVKKHIMGNDAVLVNFAYENPENRPWRFSFMAHDAVFAAGEMQQIATNPKRYTYVFGEPEETYRTALDRFSTLSREKDISVASLKNAFGVEALSKAFFDEYRDTHYTGFVDYLKNSPFKQSFFNGDEKAIRDFVKKLLGRIVFLYFIQKKGWLGASTADYQNGDKNFMSRFYEKAGADEIFYARWLSKLFFDTLNSKRPDDAFEMPDGSVVRIPYLNGGLFVREDALGKKESDGYHFLTFPPELFGELFAFFDSYNFTIYEDSPEEHTVAVDPEMLGHIFENLLEDNKDKGAFYTPKEIVHYMTQASLVEYLHTQIPEINRAQLEAFVKNKSTEENELSQTHKNQIDQKLDEVKICDPAIGSGAFPMGLLQEIFTLKERIYFHFAENHSSSSNHKYHSSDNWSPARVKEHIIQNSIYGVDIEQGAVDIARLRFWLSLIVDEEKPKPLPNLDYKIMQGNSLVSKFGFSSGTHEDETIEIDWSTDDASGGLFGQEFIIERTRLLKAISEKQKAFFTANTANKPGLAKEIRQLKLDILSRQLELMIEKGAKEDKNAVKKPSKKYLEKLLQAEGWKRTLSKINRLKLNGKPFKHFDWKLDFPEVLNPLAVANTGFDIVIGNPPYIQIKWLDDKNILKNCDFSSFTSSGDIYCLFYEKANELLRPNGIGSYITSNKWLRTSYGKKLRNYFISFSDPFNLIDFGGNKIFDTATVDTNILFWFKKQYSGYTNSVSVANEFNNRNDLSVYFDNNKEKYEFKADESWLLLTDFELKLKRYLEQSFKPIKDHNLNLYYGILTGANKTFIIDSNTRQRIINLDEKNEQVIVPIIRGKDLESYSYKFADVYLLNAHNGTKNLPRVELDKEFPSLITYLNEFGDSFKNRSEQGDAWYNLRGCSYISEFFQPKIIYADIVQDRGKFYYDEDSYFTNDTAFIITGENLKSNTLIFNSILFSYLYKKFYSGGGLGNKGLRFKKEFIEKIPLPILDKNRTHLYETVLNHIQTVKKATGECLSQISNCYEEIIDALVFELYFPEEFKSKSIAIEKHVGELFIPIEGLSEAEKLDKIKAVYEELRKEENPLHHEIKRMKTELKYLLQPILSL